MAKTIYVDWSETSSYPHEKTLQRKLSDVEGWVDVAEIDGDAGTVADVLPEGFDTGVVQYRTRVASSLYGIVSEVTSAASSITLV